MWLNLNPNVAVQCVSTNGRIMRSNEVPPIDCDYRSKIHSGIFFSKIARKFVLELRFCSTSRPLSQLVSWKLLKFCKNHQNSTIIYRIFHRTFTVWYWISKFWIWNFEIFRKFIIQPSPWRSRLDLHPVWLRFESFSFRNYFFQKADLTKNLKNFWKIFEKFSIKMVSKYIMERLLKWNCRKMYR